MDMERLAEIFEAVKVLPLRPTDVLVFRSPHQIPASQTAFLRDALAHVFGAQQKIVILQNGDDIEVVRPKES